MTPAERNQLYSRLDDRFRAHVLPKLGKHERRPNRHRFDPVWAEFTRLWQLRNRLNYGRY